MIETLDGFPADAVAVRAGGFVTESDYDQVLVPAVERAFRSNESVRLYYEIGPDFYGYSLGALSRDFWVGMRHLTRWKRVAVVTDISWIAQFVRMYSFVVPGPTMVFRTADAAAARAWLAT